MIKKTPIQRKKPVKKDSKVITIQKRGKRFEDIISMIKNDGLSLTNALKISKMSSRTFNEWLEKDEEKQKCYAYACEERAKIILNEVIEIADDETQDKTAFYGAVKVKRDALRIETRLKYLAMMYPKKYGSKVEISGDKENPLQVVHNVVSLGSGIDPSQTEEIKGIE